MVYSLLQEVLAARKGREDWMQILVIVAMAIIYGISAIFKSKSNKAEEEKEKQQQQKRAAGPGRRVRPEEVQPADVKVKRVGPEPVAKRVEVKREKAAGEVKADYVKTQELSQPKRRIAPEIGKLLEFTSMAMETVEEIVSETAEELPEFTGGAVKPLEKKYAVVPKQKARLEKVEKPLIDFTERNILRSAILHYEILGKPLALREPRKF